jgi:hypothetical protein
MHAPSFFRLALVGCALTGCGGYPSASQPDAGSAVEPEPEKKVAIKSVDAAKLPKLGELFGQGDPKVEVAPPAGWQPKGRSRDYVAAFVKERAAAVPSILIKASEAATGDFADVTPKNVVDYAAAVQATLQDPLESALPMQIGEHCFARYVKAAKISNLPAEVQVLSTVRAGRAYTIELRVRDIEDLKKYRDQAYAVAAGLKFAADAKPFDFKPQIEPAETPPAEAQSAEAAAAEAKPADAVPAEAKPGEASPPAAK